MTANISFIVFNSNGVPLTNAVIKVNGIPTKYDSSTGLHTLHGQVPGTLDLEVSAPGFKTVHKKGMATAQRPHQIYLGKEGEPWYPDVNGMPVAYSYRPRDILVVLHDHAENVSEINSAILSLPQLKGYQVMNVNWKAGLNQMSVSVDTKILLRAPADLPPDHVPALAALRSNALVQFAGPLIVHGEAYGSAKAVGTSITVQPNTQKMKSYDEGTSLAAELGCIYNVPEGVMQFDDDAGSVVIEAAKKIAASGLFSVVELQLYQQIQLFG
jgi:hypothetical protein